MMKIKDAILNSGSVAEGLERMSPTHRALIEEFRRNALRLGPSMARAVTAYGEDAALYSAYMTGVTAALVYCIDNKETLFDA